jgi:hypothetical protein
MLVYVVLTRVSMRNINFKTRKMKKRKHDPFTVFVNLVKLLESKVIINEYL